MKNIIISLLLLITACNDKTKSTEVVKRDTVFIVDTIKKPIFKVSSREVLAAVEENILYNPIVRKTFDSMVAFKMAEIQKVDMTTMRKDIGFIVDENERLTLEVIALRDSLHLVWFDPKYFSAVRGQKTDSVSFIQP